MSTTNILKSFTVLAVIASLAAFTACAGGGGRSGGPDGSGPGGGKQGAPPEAYKACEGKQEGDAVTFSGRDGESLKATCQTVDGKLVAVPEGHRR